MADPQKDLLRLIEGGCIAVKSAFLIPEHLNNIDIGEAQILSLAGTCKCDYIITDDVRALPYMKSVAEVKVLTSVFVICLLYDAGVLSRGDALNSIKEITVSRDWYGGVLEVIACEYFDEKLDNPV
jgi:predicted nucleic acid-binding protein